MPILARHLVLNLLLGAEAQGESALGARELIGAAALFGMPENAIRVALARALAAGLLASPRRGVYSIGALGRPLADDVGRWRSLPGQLVEWSGGWLAVHVGATVRSDRPALRARERAFGLLGLAELERGLLLRPDNLAGGAGALRARLAALLPGSTPTGTVFALHGLTPADDRRARRGWDTTALNAGYRRFTARLSAWFDDAPSLPLERAAREAFELGHDAIRQLVFDPWLPGPLVDADARARFVAAVERHDDLGQAIWRRFLAARRAVASASEPQGA